MNYLNQTILEGNWQQLTNSLNSMSNMEFRRTESYIRATILPTLPNDTFWDVLFHLIEYRHQAFLSGICAIEHLVSDDSLDFSCTGARELAQLLHDKHPEAVNKVINIALPLLKTEEQVDALLNTFAPNDENAHIAALLKVESPLTYYKLFTTLCHMPEGKQLALRCTQFIMKHGNDMAFNMAAIMKAYFGLEELHARFSLHIEPYELSQLDSGSDAFYHLLTGRRPKL